MRGFIVVSGSFLVLILHALLTLNASLPESLWIVPYDTAIVWALFEMFFAFPIGAIAAWKGLVMLHDRPRKPRDAFWDEGLID